MPLKILLVDDEPKVLRGLGMVIDRSGEDWKIVGQAGGGAEALSLIVQNRPDVVITDIKMPGMDGLELVEQAKKIAPGIQFIILSGYPDFKYAQQALKLGTIDYILKPPNYQDILSNLKKLETRKLDLETREQEETELKNINKEAVSSLKEQVFQELAYSPHSRFLEKMASTFKAPPFFADNFILCLIKPDGLSLFSSDEFDANLEKMNLFREGIRKAVAARDGCLLDLHNGGYCCLLPVGAGDLSVKNLVQEIHAELINGLKESITIGVSRVYQRTDQVNIAFKECLSIMRNKIFFNKNSIIQVSELKAMDNPENYPLELESGYLDALYIGDFERAMANLDQIIQKIIELSGQDALKFRSLVMEFTMTVSRNLAENGAVPVSREIAGSELANKISAVDSINDIRELLAGYTKSITGFFSDLNKPSCRKIVNNIINYLKNNYFNDITLRRIAADFFMNESYLSDLFSRETGSSFTSYLAKIRVERAKDLLKQLDLKTHEIAEMVGYKDSKYFNKVFKKHTGMTPFEYRERMV